MAHVGDIVYAIEVAAAHRVVQERAHTSNDVQGLVVLEDEILAERGGPAVDQVVRGDVRRLPPETENQIGIGRKRGPDALFAGRGNAGELPLEAQEVRRDLEVGVRCNRCCNRSAESCRNNCG